MARKENRNSPKVISGYLYTDDALTGTLVGSPAWFAWLAHGLSFYYEAPQASFTGRREPRRHGYFWYAFRRTNGQLHKRYLGRNADLTAQRLSTVAHALATVSSPRGTAPATDT
jgi:LuxR family transcriptional regulator, maltose regulon positive regulatory protein